MQQEPVSAASTVVWFEIPSVDFERATRFYETIFDAKFGLQTVETTKLGVFPYDPMKGVSGAIVHSPNQKPGTGGALVYLNCNGRLDAVAGRVKEAGGSLVSPRVDLPNNLGSFYLMRDTEGNVVGLHAA